MSFTGRSPRSMTRSWKKNHTQLAKINSDGTVRSHSRGVLFTLTKKTGTWLQAIDFNILTFLRLVQLGWDFRESTRGKYIVRCLHQRLLKAPRPAGVRDGTDKSLKNPSCHVRGCATRSQHELLRVHIQRLNIAPLLFPGCNVFRSPKGIPGRKVGAV